MAIYSLIALEIFTFLCAFFYDIRIPGLYLAVAIILSSRLFQSNKLNLILKKNVVSFLYLNLIFTILNILWFYLTGNDQLTTLILQADDVNNVTRSIHLVGAEIALVRPYGVTSNIHITALLNLILYIHLVNKSEVNKFAENFVFGVIVLSYNLQIIIMLLLYHNFSKVRKLDKLKILKSMTLMALVFLIFDYLLMESAYFDQIMKTFDSDISYELKFYLSLLDSLNLLFGIDLINADDPFDGSNYSIPIIDMGLFNIFIQYGVVGVSFIVITYKFLYKILNVNGKKFLIVNLFSLVHYFNIISFVCLISAYFVFLEKTQNKKNDKP